MKYLFSFLIITLLLTTAIFYSLVQESKAPETLEKAKSIGERILTSFSELLKNLRQEVLGIWQNMKNWFQNIWYKISSSLMKEAEKRKKIVEKELVKTILQVKEETVKQFKNVIQNILEKFKTLISF